MRRQHCPGHCETCWKRERVSTRREGQRRGERIRAMGRLVSAYNAARKP